MLNDDEKTNKMRRKVRWKKKFSADRILDFTLRIVQVALLPVREISSIKGSQ
jgi:hypothetical protein